MYSCVYTYANTFYFVVHIAKNFVVSTTKDLVHCTGYLVSRLGTDSWVIHALGIKTWYQALGQLLGTKYEA